jgi:hypothetical protein
VAGADVVGEIIVDVESAGIGCSHWLDVYHVASLACGGTLVTGGWHDQLGSTSVFRRRAATASAAATVT